MKLTPLQKTGLALTGGLLLGVVAYPPVSSLLSEQEAGSWPMITAAWNHSPSWPCNYRLYHGQSLDRSTWVVIAETTNNSVQFQSQQYGFVGVKAERDGVESEWNE